MEGQETPSTPEESTSFREKLINKAEKWQKTSEQVVQNIIDARRNRSSSQEFRLTPTAIAERFGQNILDFSAIQVHRTTGDMAGYVKDKLGQTSKTNEQNG